jgi:raffinose/stachyose/melibiose transport system substrate-binding protein
MRKFLRFASLLVALAMVWSVAACQPVPVAAPTSAPALAATEAPPTAATTAPAEAPQAEPIKLLVWDQAARPEESAIMDGIIERYQAAYPNVTVVREAKTLDDLKATLPLAMSSPEGPCISMVNQGQSDMGAFVAAGLLLPLDKYAKSFGWYVNFPVGLAALNSWTEDGKKMGTGALYGLPTNAEIVGVYYRKDLFAKYGLAVPQTYAEFEGLMKTLKEKGETPLVYGGLDGWPAIHLYSEIQNAALAERKWYDSFMFTTGDVTFENPANLEAAKKLQAWVEAGYLTKGFEGIGYDDSWQLFSSGQGAMMLTGNWLSADLLAGPNGANLGFFLVPPLESGGYKLSVGGAGSGYAISAKCPYPDQAAEYINYLFSDETAEALLASGTLPVYPVDTSKLEEGLVKDIVRAWVYANQNNSVGYYFDWVTPTMYDTSTASLQELMAGKITPEEFVAKLNQDYVKFLENK